jgi:hypothetical protein
LVADAHGLVPESVTPVRGRVVQVEVVDQAYRRTGWRAYESIPGDYSLRSVQRSPRWFDHGWVPDADDPGDGPTDDRQESGVLVRLEVDATSP